jgi:hypothetical protein
MFLRHDASVTVLGFLLIFAVFLRPFSRALVSIPEFRKTQTVVADTREKLIYFKTSPLIGGPSWLPLHVKVILEGESLEHQWDFVPMNPTDLGSLQKLVTLRATPAVVRYRTSPISRRRLNMHENLALASSFDNVIIKEVEIEDKLQGDKSRITDKEKLILEKAREFCDSYPSEIHLVQNNCWAFAFKLYDHLSS